MASDAWPGERSRASQTATARWPPGGPQHALHLTQRGNTIVEEHQAELAHHGVEARVGEG